MYIYTYINIYRYINVCMCVYAWLYKCASVCIDR